MFILQQFNKCILCAPMEYLFINPWSTYLLICAPLFGYPFPMLVLYNMLTAFHSTSVHKNQTTHQRQLPAELITIDEQNYYSIQYLCFKPIDFNQ